MKTHELIYCRTCSNVLGASNEVYKDAQCMKCVEGEKVNEKVQPFNVFASIEIVASSEEDGEPFHTCTDCFIVIVDEKNNERACQKLEQALYDCSEPIWKPKEIISELLKRFSSSPISGVEVLPVGSFLAGDEPRIHFDDLTIDTLIATSPYLSDLSKNKKYEIKIQEMERK